jgi:hypothetical protein
MQNELSNKQLFFSPKKTTIIDLIHKDSTEYEGVTEFWFKTNKDIKQIRVIINVSSFQDIISGDDTLTYKKNEWYLLVGYENVNFGRKWKFTFKFIDSTNNEEVSSIVKYII